MGRAPRRSGLQDRPPTPDLHRLDEGSLRAAGRSLSPALAERPRHYWLDGGVVDATASSRARDLQERPGCYTTARVHDGVARFADRHCRRLRRDARALEMEPPSEDDILQAFEALARAEFRDGEGIVRLACCPDASGATALFGIPRPLGHEPSTWRAVTAPFPHPGPSAHCGAKRTHQEVYGRARSYAAESGVDETLLLDEAGHLVEGARTNVLVVDEEGRLLLPEPTLGAVAGIALERIREQISQVVPCTISRSTAAQARELIAVNAVRGAVSIVALNQAPIGDGMVGSWAIRLARVLAEC